jgi:hypothetical protein
LNSRADSSSCRACARDFHLPEIHGDVAEPVGVAAWLRARGHAPQQRLEPRHQLDCLERLGEIIVGAQLQADHFVHDLPSRRQHHDRRGHAALTQLAADIEAVHPGQHDVEDDEIVATCRRPGQPGFPVAGRLDAVALADQPIAEREPESGFVLDEQDAQIGHTIPQP